MIGLMFDKVIRILLSRRFAVYLLILMVVFLILGTSLPDINTMTPEETDAFRTGRPLLFQVSNALQMQSLISSPYFLVLPLLIFLSTTLCTVKRLIQRRKKEGGFYRETSGPTTMDLVEISSLLSSEKWSVVRKNDSLVADKGGFGFWGSILFHLGLLTVFVAVVVSSLTQFSAELLLTEGFPVRLGKDAFVKIYKSRGLSAIPSSLIELKRFVPFYEKDRFAKDFSAELLIDDIQKDVHVNRPIKIGGFQLSLHRFGFSPSSWSTPISHRRSGLFRARCPKRLSSSLQTMPSLSRLCLRSFCAVYSVTKPRRQ